MATTKKAMALQRELADELAVRLPALDVTEGFGASNDPTVTVGIAAAGSPGAYIRIVPESSIQKDILGLNQNVFTPHIIQVVFEKNYAGATDNVADINTFAHILPILGTVVLKGTKVEVYSENNGTVPQESSIAVAKLTSTFNATLQYPLMSNI